MGALRAEVGESAGCYRTNEWTRRCPRCEFNGQIVKLMWGHDFYDQGIVFLDAYMFVYTKYSNYEAHIHEKKIYPFLQIKLLRHGRKLFLYSLI